MDQNNFKLSLEKFKDRWKNEDPISFDNENIIVFKLYKIKRKGTSYMDNTRATQDEIEQRSSFFKEVIIDTQNLKDIEKYISFENLSMKKELNDFCKLQLINNKIYLSLTDNTPQKYIKDSIQINKIKYQNYLDHLSKVKNIKIKASGIVKSKFNKGEDSKPVSTSAIFANVGYIVKGFEGKYLNLSKGDRTFIKNFMDEQIKDGAYNLTIKETLPLYKESINEITKIGKSLLSLTNNKNKLKSFSRRFLKEERSSLEGCWQLYFDKYLRVMLMNYKEFYSQSVFKKIDGYEKDCMPDFLAVDIYNNVDIIEIKTHKTILFRKEKNRDSYYPSHDLNKSIFQLNKYMDLKAENIETANIENKYTKSLISHDKVYRPRGILIISSKDFITSERTNDELSARLEKEIKKLKTTYNNIDIILFDELIRNLENYINYLDISLERNETN